MAEPKTLGVREILSSFRATLATARQTGEPVVIAMRRRQPAGVLLGYETWQALKTQPLAEADTSALRAELAAERQRNGQLATRLADAHRQVEELSRDLAAARQRVAELELQLVNPQTAGQCGDAWGVEPLPRQRMNRPRPGPARPGAVLGKPQRRPVRAGGSRDRKVGRLFRSQKWYPVSGSHKPATHRALTNRAPPPTNRPSRRSPSPLWVRFVCAKLRWAGRSALPFTAPNP